MVPRRSNIGWWLLAAAASLVWLGCNQVEPRSPAYKPPQPAPLLQIAESQPAAPAPDTRASLPLPHVAFQGGAQPPQASLPAMVAKLGDPVTPKSGGHASLLPPVVDESPQAAAPKKNDPSLVPLHALFRVASERLAATPAYVARLKRREVVGAAQRPEELILLKYRKDPASIHLRWIGSEAKDRELVWLKSQPVGRIYVAPAPTDTGDLAAPGRRTIALPDGPHGLGKERYAVGETGMAGLLERFGRVLDAVERGDPKAGTVTYLGKVKRPEREVALDGAVHLIPPGTESDLPKGGQRLWFFDSTLHLPVLVIALDSAGKEIEYYYFDDFLFPGHIRDEVFTPANLGRR
jgi:hypothetical protein